MMKQPIILLLSLFIFVCCSNKKETTEIEPEEKEEENQPVQLVKTEPCLDSIATILKVVGNNNAKVVEEIKNLNKKVCLSNEITSVKQIEEVLSLRDEIMNSLSEDSAVITFFEDLTAYTDKIESEFNRLGLQTIWAEGMYLGMERTSLIPEVIEQVGDEAFILKNKILALQGNTQGGEYPYMDLTAEMEIIKLGEDMITKYPNHPYTKDIFNIFNSSLTALMDVHLVGDEEHYEYIALDLYADVYPTATLIENHNTFIQNYPDSRFTKSLKNVIQSISTFSLNTEVFYIVTVPIPSKSEKIFSSDDLNNKLKELPDYFFKSVNPLPYLWLNVPVPHVLNLPKDNDISNRILAYRFFEDKEKAEKALEEIKTIIPGASLIEYSYPQYD